MVPIRVILGLYWDYMGYNGKENGNYYNGFYGWLVKIMVPFWIPSIVRHLIFRVPKRDHNFDNHPHARDPPKTAHSAQASSTLTCKFLPSARLSSSTTGHCTNFFLAARIGV